MVGENGLETLDFGEAAFRNDQPPASSPVSRLEGEEGSGSSPGDPSQLLSCQKILSRTIRITCYVTACGPRDGVISPTDRSPLRIDYATDFETPSLLIPRLGKNSGLKIDLERKESGRAKARWKVASLKVYRACAHGRKEDLSSINGVWQSNLPVIIHARIK